MKEILMDELHVSIIAVKKLDKEQTDEVYRIVQGLQQWLRHATKLNFPNEMQDKIIIKVNR